jgi:SAM-dependent methyltransferase
MLAARTGLTDRVAYKAASALDMPFADATFDAAFTFHVAMNIKDRAGLYREVARVLRPAAPFCIYDVMKGKNEGLQYPVPWAQTPATSHLVSPQEMAKLLSEAGFEVTETEDRTAPGIAVFRERLATPGGPPTLGTHLLMGANVREKSQNLLAAPRRRLHRPRHHARPSCSLTPLAWRRRPVSPLTQPGSFPLS